MATLNLTAQLQAAGSGLGAFLTWWRTALMSALPAPMRWRIDRWRDQTFLDFAEDAVAVVHRSGASETVALRTSRAKAAGPEAEALRSKLPRAGSRGVIVRLAPRDVVRRRLTLPQSAEGNLRRIVANELDRRTPFKADQVHFDARVLEHDRTRQEITVEMVIAKKAVIDEVLALAQRWNLQIARIGIAEAGREPAAPIDLAPRNRRRIRRLWSHTNAILALAAALLAGGVLYVEHGRLQQRAAGLAEALGQAKVQAARVEALNKELDALKNGAGDLGQLRAAPSPLEILDEITRLLPDDVWVYQLQIGREIHLSGFAPDASALVRIFEQSKLLQNPRFRAPLTRSGSPPVERFDLSLEFRGEGKP